MATRCSGEDAVGVLFRDESSGRLGGSGRRGHPLLVQLPHVGHDHVQALLRHTVQDQVALVLLQDLLDVPQVLIRLLEQLLGSTMG